MPDFNKKINYRPVVLVVLDGWGHSDEMQGNAINNASLPTYNMLNQYYPGFFLQASGLSVGLSWGQEGNSEVGHQVMGTGQLSYQYLPLIFNAIGDGTFYQNQVFLNAIAAVKKRGCNLHLLGLLSDGGVHSHTDHLFALLELIKNQGLPSNNVFIHAITDGRDTLPQSAENYFTKIINSNFGRFATISGRYYAMDRNKNWDRIEKALMAIIQGKGELAKDPLKAIRAQYEKGNNDEYIEPTVLTDDNDNPIGTIKDNDVVIFYNFRKDRARQITQAFTDPAFDKIKQVAIPKNLKFISMVQYGNKLQTEVAFPPQKIEYRLSQILSQHGFKQLKIAETEKYAHVTYYFNGGREKPYEREDQILIPSKNSPSYADTPAMSAYEVTNTLIESINKKIYDFILVNFANPDMVGHTGDLKAAVKAVEVVDECLKKVIDAVLDQKGCLLITADHGNAEEMLDLRNGEILTQHTNNPVPCWFVTPDNKTEQPQREKNTLKINGMLVDISPTILELFGLEKPEGMLGMSLLKFFQIQESVQF